ncbi:hypothetical protein lerEdw1_006472 [Lerista edwardsae]|nr:hypothetical protein lerEdw1_006472 [Lerista edwardsae]
MPAAPEPAPLLAEGRSWGAAALRFGSAPVLAGTARWRRRAPPKEAPGGKRAKKSRGSDASKACVAETPDAPAESEVYTLQIRNHRHYVMLKEILEALEQKDSTQQAGMDGRKSTKSLLKSLKPGGVPCPASGKRRLVKDETQDSD